MPHYEDGSEAKPNDYVKFKNYNGKEAVGQISNITTSDSCNATVHFTQPQPVATQQVVTLKDCELVHRPE